MAVFLMLEGIAGESADDHHAGEIDIAAWSLGVTNPARPTPAAVAAVPAGPPSWTSRSPSGWTGRRRC
jgi:hypothetical protein